MNEQGLIDERISELHRLIEQRLERDPVGTMRVAKENLTRLRALLGDRWAIQEWDRALASGTDEVRSILVGSSDRAVRLRSSSPFIGIVSRTDRDRIMSPHKVVRRVDPRDLA